MAISFTDKSTRYPSDVSLGKIVPVMSGLLSVSFDGQTMGDNQKINGSDLSVVGSPVQVTEYTTHYSVFNSLLTPFKDAEEETFIAVLRVYASGRGTNNTIMGIYPNTGQTARGFGLGMLSSGSLFASASSYDGAEGNTSNVLAKISASEGLPTTWDTGEWRCVAAKTYVEDTRVKVKITDLTSNTTGTSQSVQNYTRDMRTGDQFISIGQGRGGGQDMVGDKEMAAALIYDRALSDDEITSMYNYLKNYFSNKGIAI